MLLCVSFCFEEVFFNMSDRIFDKNVILVDMDIEGEGNSQYCLDDLARAICDTIPGYVFCTI